MEYFHQPVLLNEVLAYLNPQANQNFIDGTVGGGGHAAAILARTGPKGELLGLDRDPLALKASAENLKAFKNRIHLIQNTYKNIKEIIYGERIALQFSGILLDLGLSSAQVSPNDQRGFSFKTDKKLDMRFGPETPLSAEMILNNWPEEKIAEILKNYGEEPKAKVIANAVILARRKKRFATTADLVAVVDQIYKNYYGRINPATKVFQALRLAVNDELNVLTQALPSLLDVLSPGGRLAVISYHSLEDRLVKQFFKREYQSCHCPPNLPICGCGHQRSLEILTKKPIVPKEAEIKANPRSRSAKLRVAQKI